MRPVQGRSPGSACAGAAAGAGAPSCREVLLRCSRRRDEPPASPSAASARSPRASASSVVVGKLGKPLAQDLAAALAKLAQQLLAARRDHQPYAPAVGRVGRALHVAAAHELLDEQAGGRLADRELAADPQTAIPELRCTATRALNCAMLRSSFSQVGTQSCCMLA